MIAARMSPEAEGLKALFIIGCCVACIIWYVAHAMTFERSVVTRGGIPHCPSCGRQVSHRRDVCRSCGGSLYVRRQPERVDPAELARIEAEREADRLARAVEWERFVTSIGDVFIRARGAVAAVVAWRSGRRAARRQYLRSRGIQPGPLAWFKLLPETLQAIILGLSLAVPAAIATVALFRSGSRP